MHRSEHAPISVPPHASERFTPAQPIALPPDLAEFIRADSDLYLALFHTTARGTILVVKAPAIEIPGLRGPLPISIQHELYAHPAAPVIRTLIGLHDQPDDPLKLETFTNVDDPDQRMAFAAIAEQNALPFVIVDETAITRLIKQAPNTTAPHIPGLLAAADQLRRRIGAAAFDFDLAKAAVQEVTSL